MKAGFSIFHRIPSIHIGRVLLALTLIVPCAASAQLHGSYTIGSGGTYPSFTAAVSALVSQGVSGAVTFNVLNGSYQEHVVIPAITGASVSNTITFQSNSGNPANATLFYNATSADSNYVVKLNGAQYLRFHKLTFQSNTTSGASYTTIFNLTGAWDHLTIDSSALTGAINTYSESQSLIYSTILTPTQLVINGNTITGGGFGVLVRGINGGSPAAGVQILNNSFANCYYGIYLQYNSGPIISDNSFTNTAQAGIWLDYNAAGIEVTANRISTGSSQYGIVFNSTAGGTGDLGNPPRALIANNMIAMTGTGTPLYFSNSTYLDIVYNTANTAGGSSNSSAFFLAGSGASSNVIENNLFANSGGGYAFNVNSAATISASDYNDFFTIGNFLAVWGSIYLLDLPALQTAGGLEVHSVSVNPLFLSSSDLHVRSPWINGKATVFAAVNDDIDGQARDGSTPDIGADEFTPAAGSTTPLSGSYTIGSGGTYASFTAAAADLLLKGVSGPVTFNALATPGTYQEHFVLTEIPGASATNTVTFQANGAAASASLYFFAAAAESNYVVKLLRTHYVNFHRMKFSSNNTSGATYGTVFSLYGGWDFVKIDSAIISGPPNTTSPNQALIVTGPYATASSFIVNANTFTNGGYVMYLNGLNANTMEKGTVVSNNTSTGFYAGLYLQYQDSPVITGNTFTNPGYYAIDFDNCDNGIVALKNKVTSSAASYGFLINYCSGGNGDLGNPPRGLIANNMIALTNTGTPMYVNASINMDIVYNTLNTSGGSTNSSAFFLAGGGASSNIVENNLIANTGGGYAYNVNSAATLSVSDYNDLFTVGNYLAVWGNTAIADLPGLQSAGGHEASSVSVNPLFTSLTDLHVRSPWINGKATVLATVSDDIDGQARDGATPDIGADEFTPPAGSTTPLSGVYTIGSGGSYANFNAAVADLLLKGVSGPVTFNVLNGTYQEHIVLTEIPGASPTNTVTFQASNAAANATLFYFASVVDSNYVVKLLRTHYVNFHRMKLSANNTTANYGTVFSLNGGWDFVKIDSAIIAGPPGTTSTNQALIVTNTYASATSFIVNANTFTNGGYGMYLAGINANPLVQKGTEISNNTFTGLYVGLFLQYQDSPVVTGNTFTNPGYYAVDFDNCDNGIVVLKNKVVSSAASYGLMFNYDAGGNGDLGNPPRALVANNMIALSSTGTPLYVNACTNFDFVYNSASVSGPSASSAAFLIGGGGSSSNNIENNAFSNTGGGYAYAVTSGATIAVSDYNDLYTLGNFIGYWGSTYTLDLAAFRTASGLEANSVSVYPFFTSVTDLHARSPWINGKATVFATVSDDFDGQVRDGSTPDIGADEFTPLAGTTTPLAGPYTIGSGGDYGSFNAAVSDLLLRGVSGPVTFNVLNGSYQEHIVLTDIPGTSLANTVTFQANASTAANAVLYYPATVADSNYTVKLVRTEFVNFHRMKLQSNTTSGATYSTIFSLNGGWDNITIDSCILAGSPATSSTNDGLIVTNSTSSASKFIVNANTLTNGGYGIYLYGVNAPFREGGARITNNVFSGIYFGIYMYNNDSPVISGNVMTTSYTAMEVDYAVNDIEITKNRIMLTGGGYAITLNSSVGGTGGLGNPARGLITNNVIAGGSTSSPYGITLSSCGYFDVANNSVNFYAPGSSVAFYNYGGTSATITVLNNIFSNPGGGLAYYANNPTGISASDHNDLFTTGTYLAYWNGNRAAISDLRSASSMDASSLSTNPGFFSNTNLHTLSTALDSMGIPLAYVTDDNEGRLRDPVKPDIGAYEFSQVLAFFQPLTNYWNMLSLPVTIADARKTILYPSAASNAFIYTGGAYAVRDTLVNKYGYWIRFVGPQSTVLTGNVRVRDTIAVNTSWNMIGSISYPIPKAGIVQTPPSIINSNMFTYDPSLGYKLADTVQPGAGYWVRTSAAGTLILDVNSTLMTPSIAKEEAPVDLAKVNVLEFSRDAGSSADLYFTTLPEGAQAMEYCSLPPLPPEGAADIRFATNRMLAAFDGSGTGEIPILVQGNQSPLRLTWKLNESTPFRFVLVERTNGRITAQHPLTPGGSVTIPAGGATAWSLKTEGLPVEFALAQNYPNPFNPTTRIDFSLPQNATVSLRVFNLLGQEVVAPIDNREMEKGFHTVELDARAWASGVYIYRLTAGAFTSQKKMMLLK